MSATQTITIVDNDKPSIIVACKYGEVFSYFNDGPGEDYLNPVYGKNDKYGGFEKDLMQRCAVRLGLKPTSDVYVTVSDERASSDIAFPTVTMDGSELKNFKTTFLTFTPENYNI